MNTFTEVMALKEKTELKNWHLFGILTLLMLFNMWLNNNHLMTRGVYHTLLSERMEAQRIDEYFNLISQLSWWSYLLAPILLLARYAFVTMLLQLPLMLRFVEVPFERIFRVVMFASVPLLVGVTIRTLWLLRLSPAEMDETSLSFMPLALTNFLNFREYQKSAWGFFSNFNLFEGSWCAIVANGFVRMKLKRVDATVLTLAVWTALLVFQWVLLLYLSKVNS